MIVGTTIRNARVKRASEVTKDTSHGECYAGDTVVGAAHTTRPKRTKNSGY